jgi:hypothetical protein
VHVQTEYSTSSAKIISAMDIPKICITGAKATSLKNVVITQSRPIESKDRPKWETSQEATKQSIWRNEYDGSKD